MTPLDLVEIFQRRGITLSVNGSKLSNRVTFPRHGIKVSRKRNTHIWVNYNDLTATSLEIMVNKGNRPQMVLIQVRQLIKEWKVQNRWEQPRDIDDTELEHCVWSYQWAVALLEWIQTCHWPEQPVDNDPGISWTEIALALAIQQGHWLPVKRERSGRFFTMQAITEADLFDLQLTLTEQATSAYNLMCQLKGLIVQELLPAGCKFGKCQSMYIQGYKAWTTGLSMRPQFFSQDIVFDTLHEYLSLGHDGLTKLPNIQLSFEDERWPHDLQVSDFAEKTRVSR